MDLLPTSEQQEIIDATAAFVTSELPVARLHEGDAAVPLSRAQWNAMAELGWFGLGLDEDAGGVGFSLAEETLLFRELGRVLAPTNLLAASLAARVAATAGNADLCQSIVAGEQRVAFAEATDASAAVGAGVSGRFLCFDASEVDVVLCSSASGFAVTSRDALGSGVIEACLDEHTHLASVDANGASALAFAAADTDHLRDRAVVLSAAMLAGGAEATRDQAVAYACEREQFGKPIGVFQAVKHKCSDMAMRCEAASWQTLYASLAIRDGLPDASLQASAAKAIASDAAIENGRHNILVHGGYGITREYDAHLFLKRAHVLDILAGGHGEHLRRVLEQPAVH